MPFQYDDEEPKDMKVLIILDVLTKNDPEGTKTLNLEILKNVTRELGVEFTEAELYRFKEKLDPEKTGFVGFDDFVEIMGPEVDVGDIPMDLNIAFRIIDKEGKGYITSDDFQAISDALGGFLTEEDIHDIMLEANKEHNNKLSYQEFENMMSLDF